MLQTTEHDDILFADLKEVVNIARFGACLADMDLIRRVEDALKANKIQCIRYLSDDEIADLEEKESIR